MTHRAALSAVLLLAAAFQGVAFASPPPVEAEAGVAFAPHPAILVVGNEGFQLPASGVRGGSGTAEDPFRIAGWLIAASTSHGVQLVNTSAHVVIEDLYFPSEGGQAAYPATCLAVDPGCRSGSAVQLVGASNVTVRHVGIRYVAAGINLYGASDVRIVDSTLGSDDDPRPYPQLSSGIWIEESRRVSIENVSILHAGNPIDIRGSDDVRLVRSSLVNTEGTDIRSSSNVTVESTRFEGTGIITYGRVENLRLVGSFFTGGPWSFRPADLSQDEYVAGAFICGNEWIDVDEDQFALRLPASDNVTLRANVIRSEGGGVSLVNSRDSVVKYNVVETSSTFVTGVALKGSIEAHDNSFDIEGIGVSLNGVNASGNWWGSADGPSFQGPGNGTKVRFGGSPSVIEPFLAAPPVVPTDACPSVAAAGASSTAFVAPVRVDAQSKVHVNERVDGVSVQVNQSQSKTAGTEEGVQLP